ncbi:GGDEF domain-containing protein [Paenibacillus sp. J5C2022]|uniref:GGDEF domain-containing protein n=1 Tax=Paenibacillus sp. J5C2022 TaxID=2977129 RepID=UPI0021D0478F|nr:GGDEF domain-containing protein [Paenibacillus sp. J5C2022]
MTFMQWLTGPHAQLFSSSSVIVVLVLMLFMSIKLYVSYRSKGTYRLLIAGIMLMMARQTLLLLAFPGWSLPSWVHIASTLMAILIFIVINFVFMKLYTIRSLQLKTTPFLLMAVAALLLAGAQHAITPLFDMKPTDAGLFLFPVLDFYSIVLAMMMLLSTRSAYMSPKYYASLLVYFCLELARAADHYVFHSSQAWLLLLVLLLPIVYAAILFMMLFEWVIERLISTYQSSILDGLTGLYNRRHFSAKSEQLKARKPVAVIFCDIDNFKRLNDTQGHHKADGVLKRVAEIIREESSGIGHAGRYGGEELLACISTDRVKPDVVAESIRRRIEEETIVTVSVGYSTSKDSKELHELIKQSDAAMYYSKTNGKNRVTAYRSMPASAKAVMT